MIQVSQVIDFVKADLDAEGSDRYLFDQDYKPAVNKAILWLTLAFNKLFSTSKVAGENLQDLKFTRVFITSYFSRIGLNEDDLGHKIWTILDVMPEPTTHPSYTVGAVADKDQSTWLSNVAHISSDYSAARLTEAEWNENKQNPFVSGNEFFGSSSSMKSYAYLQHNNYTAESNYDPEVPKEIEIRPTLQNKLCSVRYLKQPEQIEAEDDVIEFPETLLMIISEKTSNFISRKQGDNTTTFGVTDEDVKMLLSLIQ